ncbi:hypothetical protein Tcan_03827, partial [Toxocara canis]
SLSIEDVDKTPRCFRCGVNFTQKGAFALQLSRRKHPSAKLIRRLRKHNNKRQLTSALQRLERSKSASVIAVCSGCGSTMQCGRIYRPQNDCFGDTFEESVCLSLDCTRTSVKQTGIASIVSTPRRVSFDSTPHSNRSAMSSRSVPSGSTRRRRRAASRLQDALMSEDANAIPKCNSLSAFLDSLKA